MSKKNPPNGGFLICADVLYSASSGRMPMIL